jgi:hypothetical protein
MTRVCSGCGLRHCRGECYLESPLKADQVEVEAPREPYVPSPEYLAWCEKIDGDPLRHIEPRARRVA